MESFPISLRIELFHLVFQNANQIPRKVKHLVVPYYTMVYISVQYLSILVCIVYHWHLCNYMRSTDCLDPVSYINYSLLYEYILHESYLSYLENKL